MLGPSELPHTPGQPQTRPSYIQAPACGRAGAALVVRVLGPRPFELPLAYQFLPRRWYHLALTHSPGGPLSASLVHLFVDGTLEASSKFRFPKVPHPSARLVVCFYKKGTLEAFFGSIPPRSWPPAAFLVHLIVDGILEASSESRVPKVPARLQRMGVGRLAARIVDPQPAWPTWHAWAACTLGQMSGALCLEPGSVLQLLHAAAGLRAQRAGRGQPGRLLCQSWAAQAC